MAYTKTGVRLTGGASPITVEENGWVPTITVNGLDDRTTYTATAYVVANGETFTSPAQTFTTLNEGKVLIDGLSFEYDSGGGYILSWKYASIYPVDDTVCRCYWSADPNMRDATTYIPNINPNSVLDGSADLKIPAEQGRWYLQVDFRDMYGYKSDTTPYMIT